MGGQRLTRRNFISASGGVLAGSLVFASGGIALLAPSRTWALALTTLSAQDGATLLGFTRQLYPHDTLEDAVYALVVKDLDAEAQSDAAVAALLRDGVAELDRAGGGSFLELPPDRQFALVAEREASPFFQKVRSTAVVSLYNNELAFAHFGYEGPAFQKGGYLQRGFDDLEWLPEPDVAASPRPQS